MRTRNIMNAGRVEKERNRRAGRAAGKFSVQERALSSRHGKAILPIFVNRGAPRNSMNYWLTPRRIAGLRPGFAHIGERARRNRLARFKKVLPFVRDAQGAVDVKGVGAVELRKALP